MTRIYDFLNNDWTVAEYSEKDTVSKEQHTSDTRKTIKEIRSATFDHAREYQENLPTHLQYLEWMEDLTKL